MPPTVNQKNAMAATIDVMVLNVLMVSKGMVKLSYNFENTCKDSIMIKMLRLFSLDMKAI